MSSFTFLTEDQIFGNNQLEIFKKYGTKCAVTDFSILLGCVVLPNHCTELYTDNYMDYYTNEGNTLKDRTGCWWTKSNYNDDAHAVGCGGNKNLVLVHERFIGARPFIPYSLIESISSNRVIGSSGVEEIAYGEYPQTIVSENMSFEIEKAYNSDNLRITGRKYTTDSVGCGANATKFQAKSHIEYEYNGSNYIRFIGGVNCDDHVLSDGRRCQPGDIYWVKVEPIIWLVDRKADVALSKKIIFSGVQFNNIRNYKGNFDKTDIKWFMDKYFSKEIILNRIYSQTEQKEQN